MTRVRTARPGPRRRGRAAPRGSRRGGGTSSSIPPPRRGGAAGWPARRRELVEDLLCPARRDGAHEMLVVEREQLGRSPARRPGDDALDVRCQSPEQEGARQALVAGRRHCRRGPAPQVEGVADVTAPTRSLPSRSAIVRATRSTRSYPRPLRPSWVWLRASSVLRRRGEPARVAGLGRRHVGVAPTRPEPARLPLARRRDPLAHGGRGLAGARAERLRRRAARRWARCRCGRRARR